MEAKKVKNVRYITSRKKKVVLLDGHAFYHNKGNYYTCCKKKKGCKVKAKIIGENDFIYSKCCSCRHDHLIDDKYEKKEMENERLKKIMQEKKYIEGMTIKGAVEILKDLPDGENIFVQSCTKRIQREVHAIKELEQKQNEVFTQSFKLKEFNDMIIYGNKDNIPKFKECSIIFADGTFKVCPIGWTQLYTLNGLVGNRRTTFFYCLLKKKDVPTYIKMFNIIDELTDGGIYQREYTMMGDFEIASFKFLGANVKKKCCQFHFSQCIERNAVGIKRLPKDERKVKRELKKKFESIISLSN